MISKVGRGDVVRITRTGEVGTVKGWADHERLDQHGTIIDVQVSTEKTVQVNGLALDLVALAPLKASKLAIWTTVLLALALASALSWQMQREGLDPWLVGAIGCSLYVTFDKALSAIFLRRRVKVTVPKKMYGRATSRPVSK